MANVEILKDGKIVELDESFVLVEPNEEAFRIEMTGLVNTERERRIAIGSAFTVAGVTDPIPLTGRPFDQTVYLALLTRAMALKSAGVTAAALTIRAQDDVIHTLTPDQMISLVSQAMVWFESVMAASWAMKDSADGIPADFAADTHWP